MLGFGKHASKSVEMVVLKHPDYAAWLLSQQGNSRRFRETQQEVRRLIAIFDQLPLLKTCSAPDCEEQATRATVYQGGVQLYFWCPECDPDQLGASSAKLKEVRSYWDVMDYASTYCEGRKSDLALLIKELARAKGLPERVGESQARGFFCVPRAVKNAKYDEWDELCG